MAYYTKEQISKAKEIDLLTYLQNYEPEELVYDSHNTYTTKTHDSLKISNGKWFWFSRGIGSHTALDYLILVRDYTFTEAVGYLINQKGLEKKHYENNDIPKPFYLPKKAENNNKVINYLIHRGISNSIIKECIDKDIIYQESGTDNVVFVGFDNEQIPRFASVRATNSSRYMHDVYGSDKTYSFRLDSVNNSNSLHIFESAIDLLSYATLQEREGLLWDEDNLLSLSGIYKPANNISESKTPKTIENYLKNKPNIKIIYLHLDNDEAGRLASEAIISSLPIQYKVINKPAPAGKDYNDYLRYKLGIDKNIIDYNR